MATNLFQSIYDKVDHELTGYIFNMSSNVIDFILPIFSNLVLIWVVIWGYMTMFGQSGEPLKTGVFRIIKIGLILTIGLTASTYNNVVANFLSNAPDQLAAIITGSTNYSGGAALDSLFSKVFDIAQDAWDQGGIMNGNFGMYLIAGAILLFGVLLTLITAGLILLSKIALAVLLAIGSVFIIMLLFDSTKRFFESWLGMCINLALILVLATGVASIIVQLGDGFVTNNTEPTLGNAAAISVVFGLSIIVMRQVEVIASALGGGVALATNGAIRSGMEKMRPTSIKHGINRMRNDVKTSWNAARAPDRKATAWAKSGHAAYQRKFGRGNSISSN